MRLSLLIGLSFGVTACMTSGQVHAADTVAPVPLASHRAVYELRMLHSDSGLGLSIRGRLALDFRDVCDGYTLTQRLRTEMVNADGELRNSEYAITSWESRDGRRYRFNIRHDTQGEPPEEFVGNAVAKNGTRAGTATFTKPAGLKMDLPKGTIYPTEHVVVLIREARAGGTFLAAKVFDGSGDDSLFHVSAVMGKRLPPETGNPLLAPLKGQAAWPMRLAYFPVGEKSEQPQYEISFRMFENGVSDELVMDYGDYALKGTLTTLELFPRPSC